MFSNKNVYILIAAKDKTQGTKKKSVIVQMLIKHTMIYFKNYKVGAISALCVFCFWMTVQSYRFSSNTMVPSSTVDSPAKTSINQVRNKDDYLEQMDILNKQKVDMADPRLISLIRNYWIENPSDQPYNLNKPQVLDPSMGQAAFADNRLNFKVRVFSVFHIKRFCFCVISDSIYSSAKKNHISNFSLPFCLMTKVYICSTR